jgi:polar amino acid transport system substrate-binding protein
MRRAARILVLAGAVLPILAGALQAQNTLRPYAPESYRYGRLIDESRLRFCVDARAGDWQVQQEIGEAIAGALLLEPVPYVIEGEDVSLELEDLFPLMLENCYVYLGFRLLPGVYPEWLTLSRGYFASSYVFVTRNADWRSLADVPRTAAIASAAGTTADLRLVSYLLSLGPEARWRRFPAGTGALALGLLLSGDADVALVWHPDLWAAQQSDPATRDLHVIAPAPLPETGAEVGAGVLAAETFLRTTLDEAIAALVRDGTIEEILERHGFPATTQGLAGR